MKTRVLTLILMFLSTPVCADFSPHANEVFLKFETTVRLEIGLADNVISKEERKKFFRRSSSSKNELKGGVWLPKTEFRVASKTGNQIEVEDEYGEVTKPLTSTLNCSTLELSIPVIKSTVFVVEATTIKDDCSVLSGVVVPMTTATVEVGEP